MSIKKEHISVGNYTVDVIRKDIKNMHLAVYPPHGRISISVPKAADSDVVRLFAISKLPWIKKQVKSLSEQQREQPREYIEGESIYFQGQRYLVKLQETTGKSEVKLGHKYITILTKPGTTTEQKNTIIKDWYRKKLKEKIPALLDKWEPEIGVKAEEWGIKQMRTKWGSCNQSANRIWINLELAKKPLICLEYILVHELIHLIERNHNKHFIILMDKHMPKWRQHREELNKLPVARSSWGY